jgi:hypothetical protein
MRWVEGTIIFLDKEGVCTCTRGMLVIIEKDWPGGGSCWGAAKMGLAKFFFIGLFDVIFVRFIKGWKDLFMMLDLFNLRYCYCTSLRETAIIIIFLAWCWLRFEMCCLWRNMLRNKRWSVRRMHSIYSCKSIQSVYRHQINFEIVMSWSHSMERLVWWFMCTSINGWVLFVFTSKDRGDSWLISQRLKLFLSKQCCSFGILQDLIISKLSKICCFSAISFMIHYHFNIIWLLWLHLWTRSTYKWNYFPNIRFLFTQLKTISTTSSLNCG